MTSADIPPADGRSAIRSGAGDASAAALNGRKSQNVVSVDCAARFSRRSASVRMFFCHSKTAPQLPFRRTCSVAQSAFAVVGARIHKMFEHVRPKNLQAAALGL